MERATTFFTILQAMHSTLDNVYLREIQRAEFTQYIQH
ncbi:hypothetical protein GCK32_020559 [Trichostrongylus colubriformis]|uniref:Uncharacterized protein n=1 Tax=Trichostrongylus colubriformis TaxID=6319 RepID=A0AAN8F681_TRICO